LHKEISHGTKPGPRNKKSAIRWLLRETMGNLMLIASTPSRRMAPYHFLRHPGYLGAVRIHLGTPFMLGA
jgi:protein-S-isoprenylcysteine O-methyltransferase Ste14